MNPLGNRYGQGQDFADNKAKLAFDQQQLTARLFRSQGQKFQTGVAAPVPPVPTTINQTMNNTAHIPSSPNHTTTQSQKPTVRKTPTPPSAPVGVPRPLQSMLGQRLNLRTAAGQPLTKPPTDTSFSRTGRALQSRMGGSTHTQIDFDNMNTDPESQPDSTEHTHTQSLTSKPSTPFHPSVTDNTPHTEARDRHNVDRPVAPVMSERHQHNEAYLKYLKSPFSFIDKIIENPFTEEFVYLSSSAPYDLEIVKHSQIDPHNYYTMSRAGVTHFLNNEATFTSLDQWEREYFLYKKMKDIDFFNQFRSWKAFYFWKKLINKLKTTKYSRYLKENNFLLNPCLSDALLRLKKLLVEASRWSLLRPDLRTPHTLGSFKALQAQQRENVAVALQKLNSDSVGIIAEACDTDLKQFLVANGFRKTHENTDDDTNPYNNRVTVTDSTMSGEDVPQKISRAEKAAQRTKFRKLFKFIRLADMHVMYTLCGLCRDRADELQQAIQKQYTINIPNVDARYNIDGTPVTQGLNAPLGAMALRAHTQAHGVMSTPAASAAAANAAAVSSAAALNVRKKRSETKGENPLFVVEVELDPHTGELSFNPTEEEFEHTLEQTIDAGAMKVMSLNRMSTNEVFQDYLIGLDNDNELDEQDTHPVDMVLDDDSMVKTKQLIKQGVHRAFQHAWTYVSGFQKCVDMFMENANTDIFQTYRDAPVHLFQDLMTKYETQIIDCHAIRTSVDIGILNIDTVKLRDMLLPSPKQKRLDLVTLMPEIGRAKCTELLDELTIANTELSVVPNDVAEFVNIMTYLKNVTENQENTNHQFVFIQEIFGVMNDVQVKLTDADKLLLERLSQIRHQFKTTLMLTEASLQANIDKFIKSLENKLPELLTELNQVTHSLADPMILDHTSDKDHVIDFLKDINTSLKRIETQAANYQHYQEMLGTEVSQYEKLREARLDLNVKLELWNAFKNWDDFTDGWMKKPFNSIDVDLMSRELAVYSKTYGRAKRQLEGAGVVDVFKANIEEFSSALPIITDLRNPDLLDRHWTEINKLLQHSIQADPNFCLGTLIERGAISHSHAISVISFKARQEAILQEQLNKVLKIWNELNFPLLQYKNQKDVYILGSLDDILITLDDSIVTVVSILGSHYVEPLRKEALEISHQLSLFQSVLEEWTLCQRQWMYLETIFSWQDIIRQLPDESSLFSQVTKGFIQIMRRTTDNPNCLASGTYSGLKEAFQSYNVTLDKVNKHLESYLETKRIAFPRFYFLTNDELIKVMSNQKNHHAVQPHLRKCFDNLVKLDFQDKDIKAMISAEGERVPLGVNLKVRNNVETWLGDLEKDMVKSLRRLMKRGLLDYDRMPRATWIIEKIAQVVMTVMQIIWSRNIEQALTSEGDPIKALTKCHDLQLKQLTELTGMVRKDISSIDRKKLVALITTDVHGRDVTQTLINKNVRDLHNFDWQQQLRFYWDTHEDDCVIRQANARFLYGYEYMGVTSCLVITPLTDRCRITITGALHIRYGASPAGPAGTGKTESVKDLAKAMGIFCIVFNCSEQMNYLIMQRVFSGLAQTGAWSCLDEFNRIDIEVLSVIAQQLLQIRQALLQNQQVFTFQGQVIRLQKSCGVMITMNPGYAGRTELPDNLKVLFRPVAMMVPDYAMIAEIMLFSEGFETATMLSKKMVQLYKLASEQLSQQDHYDFGMRAVKSVLVMAGALRRAEPDLDESTVLIRAMRDSNVPKFLAQDLPLFQAIVQDLFPDVKIPTVDNGELDDAIKYVIVQDGLQPVPKFVTKVVQLYDTFNVRFGVMLVGPSGGGKSTNWHALAKAMTYLHNHPDYSHLSKYQNVHTHVLNPRSVSMGELFGDLNELSQEWKEGLASNIIREAIKDNTSDRHWVVFDGPVDPSWVENMNTVLDDSMMLSLATGERIKLKHELRVLFEVQDLAVASPATVSRCGMVYMTPSDIGVFPYIKSWVSSLTYLPQKIRDYVYHEFVDKIPMGLDYINEQGVQPIQGSDLSLVTSVCRILQMLLDPLSRASQYLELADHQNLLTQQLQQQQQQQQPFLPASTATKDAAANPESTSTEAATAFIPIEEEPWLLNLESNKVVLDMCFAYAYAWGLGGALDAETQFGFNKILNELFLNVKPPGSFYDVFIDLHDKSWKAWDTVVAPFKYNSMQTYFQILVPTVDSVRYRVLTQDLLSMSFPVFVTATTGVGKTVVLQDMFERLRSRSSKITDRDYDKLAQTAEGVAASNSITFTSLDGEDRVALAQRFDFMPLSMTFSARSSSIKTQETIESRLIKVKATQLSAPHGRKMVIHIDDVNMPALAEYGDQPAIELLRQMLDYGGFYDRNSLYWKDVLNFTLLCSAAPPGGGRSVLTPRFTRHFTTLCMPSPSDSSLKKIFSAIYSGWVSQQGFKQAIVKLAEPIVNSTIELYQSISKELLPTPAKSHYTFNLRDISKVFQGILSIKPVSCSNPNTMTKLWIHECQRCFEDRLVDNDDKTWCTQKIIQLVQKNFNLDWRHDALFKQNFITFCDFMNESDRMYEEVNDPYKLVNVLESYLEQYNMAMTTQQMKLVFFEDAIKHLVRISRIIRQPRGNAMLVGVGGSGKQSLTKLACFMAEYLCLQIEVTRNFGYADFQEFLKKVCIIAGVKGQNVVFLFTENQLVEERFLEDINNILNSGEVPNLFPKDELQKVLEDLTPIIREERLKMEAEQQASGVVVQLDNTNTGNNLYNTFIQRIRDNLHVVLCLSPVGDAFRRRLRMFPSLINCTTIDWFTPWPEEALLSVSQSIMQDIEIDDSEVREALAKQSVFIHTSVEEACAQFKSQHRRHIYTTPKSYLDLLNLYKTMLFNQKDKLNKRRLHLLTGLRRLKDTKVMVNELSETLEKLKPTLIEKAKETEALLQKVAIDSEKADKVRHLVEIEEKEVSIQTAEVREEEASARANLELAMPALRNAVKALERLKKAEISEVRSLPSPPVQVVRVLEAVCILLGENTDWDNAKKVLVNVNFVKLLRDYPKQNMDAKMIRRLNKYVSDPQLSEEKMMSISRAACSMMMWVTAMHTYYHVDREVAPKIKRVEELKMKLDVAEARLKSKQDELNVVVENVRGLQERCRQTEQEKKTLDDKSRQTEARLERAQQLIVLLSGEEGRWTSDTEVLQDQLQYLVGDIFIAAACISYYGGFTGEYRTALINKWLQSLRTTSIPVTHNFSLRECLGTPVDIRQWIINGLPTDDVSIDSAICSQHALRWPLIIDPQEQAKKWIKNERKNKLHVARIHDKDMVKKLELCIRNGLTLLIEDIGENVDSVLDPVLNRQTFTHGNRSLIRIGESDIDYDPRFQLYLTTKLPNPHYLPEVCIKVTLLNFTVTRKGMEDQLLGEVVRRERADIEDKKNRLVVSMAQDRKELSNIEEKILTMLQESQTLILDDLDLIQTLKDSKATSQVIMDRVKQTHETQVYIEEIRQKYVPIAVRGSIIYFAISDLALIDSMYQYSLEFFIRFFNLCIDHTTPSEDINTRINSLLTNITTSFFNNICRGLFEKHKMIFSFNLMSSMLRQRGSVTDGEWITLLRGSSMDIPVNASLESPLPDVINNATWTNLQRLEVQLQHTFGGLVRSIMENKSAWDQWITSPTITTSPIPAPFTDISPFNKLLLVKTLRFDQFLQAIRDFISSYEEGKPLVNPPQASLAETFKDSDSKTPIVFVLSTGADPTSLLFRLANELNFSERLHVISLGQGQGDNAKKLVETAMRKGDWVLLQNCHLAISWMPQLEALVEQLDNADEQYKVLPSFRLWLTSMPSNDFPVSVLQKGIKITNEPPQGIRANLLRSYTNVLDPEDLQYEVNKPHIFKNMVFGLCFFHAVIQERKKFGPLGWNKVYEFNDSDLETSLTILKMALAEHDYVPWDTLLFMSGEICYGGRVTDDWDRRCLMTILKQFYTPKVLNHQHQFTENGIYHVPASSTLDEYVNYITNLPAQDGPEIFGMNDNANITFLNQHGQVIVQTLLSVQPRDVSSGSGRTSDQIVSELAAEMELKLPALLDKREAGPTTFTAEEDETDPEAEAQLDDDIDDFIVEPKSADTVTVDSMAEFLKQEIDRFNKLLTIVKTSLIDLQKAIKGQVVMSSELDLMYTSLLNNQVPAIWSKVAPPSLKNLASWIVDLHERVASVRDWLRNGKPVSFWLSGFFFLQGFMTGVLQTHARRYRIPIDTISFSYKVLDIMDPKDLTFPAEDGVFIHGLYTTGASWDAESHSLVDSPVGELVAPLPVIHFMPKENYTKATSDYACPVYKTAVRAGVLSTTGHSTNFVVDVHLPTNRDPDYWVLKGVAILCQPDNV